MIRSDTGMLVVGILIGIFAIIDGFMEIRNENTYDESDSNMLIDIFTDHLFFLG